MLPKQLKYGSKVESAPAKSSRVNIAPNNGTSGYNLGDTIIFNIPTRQNLVLVPNESYLKFDLNAFTATGANAMRWDSCGAHGLIQRIRIFHGSNLLQDIDNYNLLTKMLYDIQVPGDATYGKLNVLAGTRSDLVVAPILNPTTAATFPTFANTDGATMSTTFNLGISSLTALSVNQINSGDLIKAGAGTNTITGGPSASNTYCLNLNCLLGTLCTQNYFPLFACTSVPLRMEITLVSDLSKAMNCTTLPTAYPTGLLSNVEYIANFIELGDSAMELVSGSLNGEPLQFVVPDYRNYQFSYALALGSTSSTQVSMAIPAKFSSLKSLFVTIRDQGTGALTYFPLSSVTTGLVDYQFRIGSSIFPPKAVNTYPEMFSEVLKAIGSMSDLNTQPSIDKFAYSLVNSLTANAGSITEINPISSITSGSFYIGIDLENYINADKTNIFAGWNSNTDDIFAIMNFNSPSAINVRFDAFAMFDTCIVFENGTSYVRF